MREKIRKITFVVVVSCFLFSLSNSVLIADEYKDAKKAYEAGQNDEALRLLVVKLRKDNDHKDGIALLKIVLPLVIDKHLKSAQDYEARKDWDNAFSEYETLIKLNDMLSSITPLEETKVDGKKVKKPIEITKVDVRNQRENVINNAAEAHYLKGIAYMQTIGSSGRATTEFDASRKYIPDYKDCRELSAEAAYRDATDLLAKKGLQKRCYEVSSLPGIHSRIQGCINAGRSVQASSYATHSSNAIYQFEWKNSVRRSWPNFN